MCALGGVDSWLETTIRGEAMVVLYAGGWFAICFTGSESVSEMESSGLCER